MESALDVLSRAASLLQDGKKKDFDRKESTGSNSSEDSGYEENPALIKSPLEGDRGLPPTSLHIDQRTKLTLTGASKFSIKEEIVENCRKNQEKSSNKSFSTLSAVDKRTSRHNLLSDKGMNSFRFKPYDRCEQKPISSQDFELPSVDDHFRKSLGDKYDIINYSCIGQPPSSVDEHFLKALGTKWYSLDREKYETL